MTYVPVSMKNITLLPYDVDKIPIRKSDIPSRAYWSSFCKGEKKPFLCEVSLFPLSFIIPFFNFLF